MFLYQWVDSHQESRGIAFGCCVMGINQGCEGWIFTSNLRALRLSIMAIQWTIPNSRWIFTLYPMVLLSTVGYLCASMQ